MHQGFSAFLFVILACLGLLSTVYWIIRLFWTAMMQAVDHTISPSVLLLLGGAIQMTSWLSLCLAIMVGLAANMMFELWFAATFVLFVVSVSLMSLSDALVLSGWGGVPSKLSVVLTGSWLVFGWVLIPAAGAIAFQESESDLGRLSAAVVTLSAFALLLVRFMALWRRSRINRVLSLVQRIVSDGPWQPSRVV